MLGSGPEMWSGLCEERCRSASRQRNLSMCVFVRRWAALTAGRVRGMVCIVRSACGSVRMCAETAVGRVRHVSGPFSRVCPQMRVAGRGN